MMTAVGRVLCSLIENALKNIDEQWAEGPYVGLRRLQPDNRGEVGEKFLCDLLTSLDYEVELSHETDPTKKHWDLRLNGEVQLEVKTATLGTTKTFQHENLEKDRDFDGVVLLDIAPDKIYLTCAAKSSIPWTSENDRWSINPKKLHRRRQGIAYKWDLHLRDVENRVIETLDDVRKMFEEMMKEVKSEREKRR